MNERIKELALQAERTFGGTFAFNGGEVSMIDLEKFAELIVKECQTVVEWAISVDSTIDRVPVLIREHFGVEE
jgi:hypothetical protein